jgi:hypothetical protein
MQLWKRRLGSGGGGRIRMRIIGSIIIIALGVALGLVLAPLAFGSKILSRSLWDRFVGKEGEQ